MSNHPARAHRLALLMLTLLGCGEDATASNTSNQRADAGDREADTAAGSGDEPVPARAGRSAERSDAGRPAQPDRSDAGAFERDAGKPAVADGEQAITLRFRAQVEDAAFACGRVYLDQGSTRQPVTPRDLRMFIQEVALLDETGAEVSVRLDTRDPWQTPDVALLDFEDATGECFGTSETNHEITGVVPKGKYRGLRFSHGVPEQLNHADPKTFPPPLQTPGMSWNWLLGLRFVRFEMGTQASAGAAADAVDNDAGIDPGSYSLHIGSTGCAGSQNAGTIRCNKPNRSGVELKSFDPEKNEVVLDVSQLLSDSDLSATVECHSGTPNCEAAFKALGVDYATGQPSPTQSAFRIK